MGCTLGHLLLGVQPSIQFSLQLRQFSIAFHAAELAFPFQESGGGPSGRCALRRTSGSSRSAG